MQPCLFEYHLHGGRVFHRQKRLYDGDGQGAVFAMLFDFHKLSFNRNYVQPVHHRYVNANRKMSFFAGMPFIGGQHVEGMQP